MKKIKSYFFKGLLYFVPIAVLVWVIIKSYVLLNSIIGKFLPENFQFLGIILLLCLITIIGYLGNLIIESPINSFFKKLLAKAPLLKTIYTSIKDLMNTFIGKKKGFKHAVFVKLSENSNLERIGFITNDDLSALNINKDRVLVYIPHSYNFSGNLFVVKQENITPINAPSSEIMKLIVSGGVAEIEN
tara:strand:+ start:171 stop:734 length:564 start_codon:yes stop_codon:yes gene_type:complete